MHLTRLRIRGYRRLLDVDIALKPFQVLLGANGSGKTTFLDALALLAASARGQLASKLSEGGGLSELLTRDKAAALELDTTMPVPGAAPLDYALRLAPQGQGFAIEDEHLTQQRGMPTPFRFIQAHLSDRRYFDANHGGFVRLAGADVTATETVLSQIPRMLREADPLRVALAATTFYGALDVSPRSPVRLPQPMQPAELPGPHGEDLVSCLYSLRETDAGRFEALEDTLRAAFPDFEGLRFPPAAAGVLSMTWKDRHFSKPLYPHQLSEGSLRFLWLATLLQSRSLGAITLLDEPEISFHPELQGLLVDLMREASKRSLVVVATHSDRLVRFLQPEELLVVDTDAGIAKITRGDELDIADWLLDYSLDELWLAGRLGGRS